MLSHQASPVSICSVITEKYIPFARTLCESFLEQEPGGSCFILIVDGLSEKFDTTLEKFKLLTPQDLRVPLFDRFVQKYTAFELCCAMKPYLLHHLIAVGKLDRVLYFDSDIVILSSLQKLFAELDESSVIVTPHLDADFPPDGKFPDDAAIMKAGVINGGFIGVRGSDFGLKFLEWWSDKLKDRCINNQAEGYFVDQKYLEYASVLFPEFKVLHSVRYNVAYWNLHSRQITKNAEAWLSNNELISFFHFSGFDPEADFQISRHQNRINLNTMPKVQELCALYAAKLFENGYLESKSWSYGKANELNGESIEPDLRLLLQKLDVFRPANLNGDGRSLNHQWPEITVVLALDKTATNFSRALGSILLQDYCAVEVIVVTMGMPVDIKRHLHLFDDWAECIHLDESAKLSEAANIGIEAAKGSVVAWMTQTDCLTQGALSRVAEHFNNDPSLEVLIGQNAFDSPSNNSTDMRKNSLQDIGALLNASFNIGSGIFSRKRALDQHGALRDYLPLAMSYDFVLGIVQSSKVRVLENALLIPSADAQCLGSEINLTELEQIVEIYLEKQGRVPRQWLKKISHQRAARASHGIEIVEKVYKKVIYFIFLSIYSLKYSRSRTLRSIVKP